jgi:hypothetical protein
MKIIDKAGSVLTRFPEVTEIKTVSLKRPRHAFMGTMEDHGALPGASASRIFPFLYLNKLGHQKIQVYNKSSKYPRLSFSPAASILFSTPNMKITTTHAHIFSAMLF